MRALKRLPRSLAWVRIGEKVLGEYLPCWWLPRIS
jgi:hypothetical protein